METINGILFFVILGLQIVVFIPARILRDKAKIQLFIPFITLLLYIWYESYSLRPEVLATVPIRIDLLLLHPAILVGFITTTIRWIILIKKRKGNLIVLFTAIILLLASLAGLLYYILVTCGFYQ